MGDTQPSQWSGWKYFMPIPFPPPICCWNDLTNRKEKTPSLGWEWERVSNSTPEASGFCGAVSVHAEPSGEACHQALSQQHPLQWVNTPTLHHIWLSRKCTPLPRPPQQTDRVRRQSKPGLAGEAERGSRSHWPPTSAHEHQQKRRDRRDGEEAFFKSKMWGEK